LVSRLLNHCIKQTQKTNDAQKTQPTQKTNDTQKTQNYCCITVHKSCRALNYYRTMNYYLFKNYWCFTVQKARDTSNYCCYPELSQIIAVNNPELLLRNIELLPTLLFKKICRIFSTVYTCNFPFLFAYKRLVSYV
jgi:hypothetical protein